MKLELLAVCDQAIVDVRTNRLSMISLLDAMQIANLPAFLDEAVIVMQFSRQDISATDNVADVEVKLGQQVLISKQISVGFGDGLKSRHMMSLAGLPIQEFENLLFSVKCEAQEAIWTVEIERLTSLNELAPGSGSTQDNEAGSTAAA